MCGIYGYYSYYKNDHEFNRIAIYTDRALYRPGQKVQAAAIFYTNRNGFENEVQAGREVTATLYDANYKEVESKKLTTDAYGTASTEFLLPTKALSGRYQIRFNNSSKAIRVEEYKRPTFQVEMPDVTQDYKAGDTLTVQATAKSYAGVPVQGAKVRYTVERRRAYWWFSYRRYWMDDVEEGDNNILSGEALTDAEGHFEVKMPLVLPESRYPLFYNFVMTADVTDVAGETHQGLLSVPLGNRKTAITADLPEMILKEQMPPLKLHVLNAGGKDVSTSLRYQIDGGKWISATSNTALTLPKLKSGKHLLKAEYGEEKLEQTFVVFSLDDKSLVTDTTDWFYISARQFADDTTPVTVQIGSSYGDLHVFYSIVAGNSILDYGAMERSGDLINKKFTYREDYGDGIALNFAWVRNGKVYNHTAQIKRPLPDKELRMKWETFRDRLTPGQQEEWTLSITDVEGKPVAAQLMATLFDKSLDQILVHNWELSPALQLSIPSVQWFYGQPSALHRAGYRPVKYLNAEPLSFSRFDDSLFPNMFYGRYMFRRVGVLHKNMAMAAKANVMTEEAEGEVLKAREVATADAVYQSADETDQALSGSIGGLDLKEAKASDEEGIPQVELRQNLQETAFFYPQLMADSTGLVSLKFTLPESLTTWRFLSIAHTKDMMHGFLSGEAVAQKEVMIQPNLPRFIRTGDKATISARVFNTTDKPLTATVRLVLSDPESNAVVYSERSTETLPANQSIATTFPVDGSQLVQRSLLVCTMTVETESHSDGEQSYLPVLSNMERVTVSVPFTQNEPGTKEIDLSKLFPTAVANPAAVAARPLDACYQRDARNSTLYTQHSKLSIEYTNNPAWLMVQALPTVAQPCDKNAISQAAAFYANSLGLHILNQAPQAKHVFESWKREQTTTVEDATLLSSLSKNEELKDLLLNETPWVMDADRETEQMNRLADFFDENLMQQRNASAIENMRQLQNGDGSWSWYPGMRGSLWITISVSEMLVRLNKMAGKQQPTADMLTRAFRFMDSEMVRIVDEMKKEEKKGHQQTFPGGFALEYLYLTTLDGRQHDAKTKVAQTYLKNLLKKQTRNQSIYAKALSAIILNSATYIKSLKEYTVYSEEMGRYYDTQRAAYSWRDYRIPTQVAAIEAIQLLTPQDTQTLDEMRRWLLQEKRTQAWDTPINSVNAIYAFLNEKATAGSEKEATESGKATTESGKLTTATPAVLAIDGSPIGTSTPTAGIGYVKTTLPITSDKLPHTFTAEKTSKGTSWGAVYAQFMQSTSDITDQQSGISVKREIITSTAVAARPLDACYQRDARNSTLYTLHSPLKIGDRIKIRITIEAQRDYDFVQVIDRRAACMEPVSQLSGYQYALGGDGAYCTPKDYTTNYYFDRLSKGKHVIETEYYIDRAGTYETGTCVVECAYAPAFRALSHSLTFNVLPNEK
jgi:hypothetical protein